MEEEKLQNEKSLELIKFTAWQVAMYYAQLQVNGIPEPIAKELTIAFQRSLIGGPA